MEKHCRCSKQKIEKSRRSQEKGEKPQGYLPTLEAKVNHFFKKKKRENEPISNVDLKRKYVLMKKKKGRKERRRR